MILAGRITRIDGRSFYVVAGALSTTRELGPMEAPADLVWAEGDRVLITTDLDGAAGRFAILARLPAGA